MNRLLKLILIAGLAGMLVNCGSSVTSSTKPGVHDEYSVVVTPDQFTLNTGDWSTITAKVELSHENSTPAPITPQPTLKFFSSDSRVTVSPGGEVCAGQWDTRYLTCTPTVFPQCTLDAKGQPVMDPSTGKCVPNPKAGQLDIPTGQVTITAYNDTHNVSGITLVTIHPRAQSIALSAPGYPTTGCVSQGNQVKYLANPSFVGGVTAGTVLPNDYTWTSSDPNVAVVGEFGAVVARGPGVANIYAKLNNTLSAPLAFATCPPAAISLGSAPFTSGKLPNNPPYPTSDLLLNKGDQEYLVATVTDINGAPLTNLSLNYLTSDLLTGSVSTVVPLVSKLSASTSGRFNVIASCEPSTCNNSVGDFVLPVPGITKGIQLGFGYPIYSNTIGVTVQGNTSSFVLVTNSADVANPLHRLLVYDSESLAVTQRVELANLPNSLVVAPNGSKAYLGSDAGLVVVDLTSYQSSIQTFPVAGGLNTDFVSGKVLGVSPDSRFVVVSDVAHSLVFFIDTTGTKVATRYVIPGISAVTFTPDNSNIWIGGSQGVYVFNADAFVLTAASRSNGNVNALAWVPDGLSYVASGSQLVDYSTCDDTKPQPLSAPGGTPQSLSTTVMQGVPHVIGLSATDQWLNYAFASTGGGNVCAATVVVSAPVSTASSVSCANPQVSFSQRLQEAFITGYPSTNGVSSCATPQPAIHGYDANDNSMFALATANNAPITPLSGGVLSDGRFVYIGSFDASTDTSTLHRFAVGIDSTTGIGTKTGAEDLSSSVELVPSLVAVVPK